MEYDKDIMNRLVSSRRMRARSRPCPWQMQAFTAANVCRFPESDCGEQRWPGAGQQPGGIAWPERWERSTLIALTSHSFQRTMNR